MTAQSESLPVRRKRRKGTGRPPGSQPPGQSPDQTAVPKTDPVRVPAGWRTIARKEFADEIGSLRFLLLTVVLTLAGAAAVYATAGEVANVAPDVSGEPSVFLVLFTSQIGDIPSFIAFIILLGPLIGIAFGFDGINGERSEGTLPRLLAQPIHRDDVINGKFVAGLAVVGVILTAVVGVISAIGIIQLGILPSAEDVLRIMVWVVLTIVYVGFWLALALLCSVLFRRAATSALVALSVWLILVAFMPLIISIVAGVVRPIPADASPTGPEARANLALQVQLGRLTPNQLYSDASRIILNPRLRTVTPGLITAEQAAGARPGLLSLDQSLLLIWPQFVGLIAGTAGVFAVAYVSFMRQEVRA